VLAAVFLAAPAAALDCGPGRLGVSRTVKIDASPGVSIGGMQYGRPLPLKDKEVVLTFDDGPLPGPSDEILAALGRECVKATFFMVGNMAANYPHLARRIAEQGHTVAAHTYSHPYHMKKRPLSVQLREIETGFAAVAAALGDHGELAPFFRYPGLSRSPAVDAYLLSEGKAVFSADIVGDDWTEISSRQIMRRVLRRLAKRRRGIILLHDIKPETARMLPRLLRTLKRRGYRIVPRSPPCSPRRGWCLDTPATRTRTRRRACARRRTWRSPG
jgi:peptidoglycan/xylan/chitin deacetylase (PgdA/CDA1 family)